MQSEYLTPCAYALAVLVLDEADDPHAAITAAQVIAPSEINSLLAIVTL